MRDRTLMYGFAVLFVLALVLPACSSSGVRGDVTVPKTKVGTVYNVAGGKLQLVKIDGPGEDRTMSFLLRNKSGMALEDLTARVLFYLPPPADSVQAYGADPKEVTFSSFAGEDFPVTVTPELEGEIVGWKLLVKEAVTVAREGDAQGSLFLDGALECTKIVDKLTSMTPMLSIDVENVGGESLELLEYQVVITKSGQEPWKSPWKPFPGKLAAGASMTLTPDVTAAPTGAPSVLLKIQRSVL